MSEPTTIDGRSKVAIGVLGGIFGVLLTALVGGTAFVWKAAAWLTNVEHRFEQVEQHLGSIDEKLDRVTNDRWTTANMRQWSQRYRELNPEASLPNLDVILGR